MDEALEAFKSGDSDTLQKILNGEDVNLTMEETVEEPVVDAESVETPETSEVETQETESDASVEDVVVSEAPVVETLPDTEEITITDSKGRRPYTIDYTDRAKTKKAYEYAAGFRKMQAERDQERQARQEDRKVYDKLEAAWGEGGVEGIRGVIQALAGEDDAVEKFLEMELSERERLKNMSPQERADHDRQREEDARRLEWETKMGDLTAKEQKYAESLQQAEETQLKGHATQALGRFNFDGKLGNPQTETMLNKTIWTNAIEMLEKHTPDGVTPTQANFNKAFEIAYSNLSSTVRSQINKGVEKNIETKKVSAARNAANMAKKGMAPKSTSAEELEKTIDDGDFSSAFKSIFSSTKKLF